MEVKPLYKSKSRQNIINFKNEYFFSKYSNSTLFKKRELQLESKKNKAIFNTKTLYNKKNINPKINIKLQLSPKILKKAQSIPTLFSSLSSKRTFHTTTNLITISSLKKSPSMNYYKPNHKTPHLCLSEEELVNKNIIYNSDEPNYNERNHRSKRFVKIFQTDILLKTPYNHRKKICKDNIDFLLNLKEEVDKFKKSKKKALNEIKKLQDLKDINLNKKDYGSRKLIKKINIYHLLKYLTASKKERIESINEEYLSKIDYIEEKINSRQRYLKLFNIKFIKKLANYIKFLDNVKEVEKRKNISLLKEKIEYKQKIEQMKIEIEKMEIKKNQIIKWIFLQIQVKEKILVLPYYYKKIIESNKRQILEMQGKFYEKEKYIRNSKKEVNKSGSRKKNTSIKKIVSSFMFKKSPDKTSSEKSLKGKILNNIKEANINNSNKKVNFGINNSKEFFTKEEFDKILFWKYSPIFNTSEEFVERLKQLDTQNIYLLKYYNKIQSKIYDSLKELRNLINSKDKSELIEKQIKEKSNQLEKLKNRNKSLLKIYSDLKEDKNIKIKPIHDTPYITSSSNSNNFKLNKITINKNKIFYKINQIYETCKILNNVKFLELLDYNTKKANNKEEEIICIMEYIECSIDGLLEKIRYYKRDENKTKLLQKIINEIDKYHKKEKPGKSRTEDLEKSLKLIEKIKNKNNKVFLNNKKVDYYYFNMKNKKGIDDIEVNKNKDDFPTLNEFLKNIDLINDIYLEKRGNRKMSKKKTRKRKNDTDI